MLKKVEITNINSIKKAEFDFTKGRYQYKNDMVYNNGVVSPIAFYGSNGSGKSSFLKAFSHFVLLLTNEPSQIRGFIPHFESNNERDGEISLNTLENSSFKLQFELNSKNYIYSISTSVDGYISNEELYEEGVELFSRSKSKYTYEHEENEVVSEMFPLLRTLDIEKNDAVIHSCYEYLSNIGFIDAAKKQYQIKIAKQKSYKDIIVEKSSEIKEILSKYREFPLYDVASKTNELGEKEYSFTINYNNGKLTLPWILISGGMENQSMLLAAALSLPENGLLIIDELDDALHPLTILDFINAVKERNIQLIFSSHNTYILQSLRPDQIFFAHWKSGYSQYKRLSEIYPNIREINNIEKMYLSNLFDEDIKKWAEIIC